MQNLIQQTQPKLLSYSPRIKLGGYITFTAQSTAKVIGYQGETPFNKPPQKKEKKKKKKTDLLSKTQIMSEEDVKN